MGRPKKKTGKPTPPKLEPDTPSPPPTFSTRHLSPVTPGPMGEQKGKMDKESLLLDLQTTLDFSSDLMPEIGKCEGKNGVASLSAVTSTVTAQQHYDTHHLVDWSAVGPQKPSVEDPQLQNLYAGETDQQNAMTGDVARQKSLLGDEEKTLVDDLEQQIAEVQQNFPVQSLDQQNSLEGRVNGFNGYPTQSVGSSSQSSIGSSLSNMPTMMNQACNHSPSTCATTSSASYGNGLSLLADAANANAAGPNANHDPRNLSSNGGHPWQQPSVQFPSANPSGALPQNHSAGPPNPIKMFGMSRIHSDNCWEELLGKRFAAAPSNVTSEKKPKLSTDQNLKSLDYIGIPQNCIFTPPSVLVDDQVQVDPVLVLTKQEPQPDRQFSEYVKVSGNSTGIEHAYWQGRACVPEGNEKLGDAHNSLFAILENVLCRLLEMTDEMKHANMEKEQQALVQNTIIFLLYLFFIFFILLMIDI